MNHTQMYINQNYKEYLKDHTYINKNNYTFIKKGFHIKAIKRNNLNLEIIGKIIDTDKQFNFIRTYSLDKKYRTIYPNDFFIFVKKPDKKQNMFKKSILNYIKSVEKNKVN